MKSIAFIGTALDDLRAFPPDARRAAGHQLDRIQRGLDPDDSKPMRSIGPGVREIRVRDETGAFRVIYVANLPKAVYVLHAFGKKTQQTAKRDMGIAKARWRQVSRRGVT
jgi:phage-related protein